jgi:RNA polymerase sigma-70 factor (ECF subfamily)
VRASKSTKSSRAIQYGEVRLLPVPLGDAGLVTALRARQSGAWNMLFDRYGSYVERLIVRVVGLDPEVPDLINEVFARAVEGLHQLKEPSALKGWIGSIAIFTARVWIRNRTSRRKWLAFLSPHDLPEIAAPAIAPPEVSETLEHAYTVLKHMPADERIAFALRFIDSMELQEIAEIVKVSLSTVKRRLQRAERMFLQKARQDALLSERVAESVRWRQR